MTLRPADFLKVAIVRIPELTPSNNVLLRMHWRDRRQVNRDWFYLVKEAFQIFDIPNAVRGEVRGVRITSLRLQLADRIDNLAGGAKPLVDALKAAKLIFDDNDKHLVGEVVQEHVRVRAAQGTRIELFFNRN